MDIRQLSENYAVSPQITPLDVPQIAAAGFTTVLCNRPDPEVYGDLQSAAIEAACEAANLTFHDNPFDPNGFCAALIEAQKAVLDGADGPVLAYCASGNRSTVLWCFANAARGDIDRLIATGQGHGYVLDHLRPQLEAYAAQSRS